MVFAYIAGPYSADHAYQIERNKRQAKTVGEELALMGYFPIIPHTNSAHMDGIQGTAFWLSGTLELMVKVADIVVMLPMWRVSHGAYNEQLKALECNIPIFYWPKDMALLAARL